MTEVMVPDVLTLNLLRALSELDAEVLKNAYSIDINDPDDLDFDRAVAAWMTGGKPSPKYFRNPK